LVAKGIVSGVLAVTRAAQRVLRTDLDHFLGGELAVAWAGDRRRLKYLLLLLGGHGGVGQAVDPACGTPTYLATITIVCGTHAKPAHGRFGQARSVSSLRLCWLSPRQLNNTAHQLLRDPLAQVAATPSCAHLLSTASARPNRRADPSG
jgi:hypothetical protein